MCARHSASIWSAVSTSPRNAASRAVEWMNARRSRSVIRSAPAWPRDGRRRQGCRQAWVHQPLPRLAPSDSSQTPGWQDVSSLLTPAIVREQLVGQGFFVVGVHHTHHGVAVVALRAAAVVALRAAAVGAPLAGEVVELAIFVESPV